MQNFKYSIALIYLILFVSLILFLISNYNISDFFSYDFIRLNKETILEYKKNNFFILTIIFFIFSIIWVLLLGFAMPLLIFSGFVFGKWWGILIAIISTTVGATLLYLLANLFFKDIVEKKFAPKFIKLKKFFNENELLYFTFFRFVGGGGTPYAIQNILPVLFNMSTRNYILATFIGSLPSMFITVAIGSGIENIIDQNEKINFLKVISSSEIYIPIFCFFILLILGFVLRKNYFKE